MVDVYSVALSHELVHVRLLHDMFENKKVLNHKIVYNRILVVLVYISCTFNKPSSMKRGVV